ncbi:MAG: DUF6265 family protein [Proteobacteria bacterium]|jgi:hypothetical protein|nr:hypothetical protein [Pseudomonadales bacterium]MDA0804726.1 DUF6265 family protein [Pseudomonadota bacterium]MDA0895804.1 DUF6265 family protein [Pseudomonadota bacterium]
MKMTKFANTALATLALVASVSAFAAPEAKIEQLTWMTGNWAGALGPNQLEENWIGTDGRSLAAMVRMTGDNATSMFEMITIEEVDGSLELNIQQWNPGMSPRTPGAQKMRLMEIDDNSVKFEAVGEGGMKTLGYSHPDADTFIIHVEQAAGAKFDINLKARSIWK